MSFDERAERCLSDALRAAEQTGYSTRGGNLRFPISSKRIILDKEIVEYCNRWIEPITPAPGIEVGWRPRLDATDLTVIQTLSKDLMQCQGRVETVNALAPIAAALICGIPADIAMRCPSTAPFWDWCEKHRLRPQMERPVTALRIPDDSKKSAYGQYHDPTAVTSRSVREYEGVKFNEAFRAIIDEGILQLEERDMSYISPGLEEANHLMDKSMRVVMEGYSGQFYMHAEMEHPHRITTGQLIAYCKQIWHDSELYHLATRWRPAYMPNARSASKDYEKRGGIYLPDKYQSRVSIMGSPSICQGLSAILGAIRIRLHPAVARTTRQFENFFEFMNWDPRREAPWRSSCVSDVPSSRTWRMGEEEDLSLPLFAHEELMMGRALRILMACYNGSQGQYQGSDAFPGVSWSREDFVSHLLLWWPHADIQQAPKFRYVPHFMDKGGLELQDGGAYFCAQGKASFQGTLMPMLASLMCGIPAEIAALLRSSDMFWSYICEVNGVEAVQAHRARLRSVRELRCTPDWHARRAGLKLERLEEESVWTIEDRVGMRERSSMNEQRSHQGSTAWGAQKDWGAQGGHSSEKSGAWRGSGGQTAWQHKDWSSREDSAAWTPQTSRYDNAGKTEPDSTGWAGRWGGPSQTSWKSRHSHEEKPDQAWGGPSHTSWKSRHSHEEKPDQAWGGPSQTSWKSRHSHEEKLDQAWGGPSQTVEKSRNSNEESSHKWTNQSQPTEPAYQSASGKCCPQMADLSDTMAGLRAEFEFSGWVWAQVPLAKSLAGWTCLASVFNLCLASVGTFAPKWDAKNFGDRLACTCEGLGDLEIIFLNQAGGGTQFDLVALHAKTQPSPALAAAWIALVSVVALGLTPSKAVNEPSVTCLVDCLADRLLPPELSDLHAVFAKAALAKLEPDPIEFVPCKSVQLTSACADWPPGSVVRIDWEAEDRLYCRSGGKGQWVLKSSLGDSMGLAGWVG